MTRIIATAWEGYATRVIPSEAPTVQRVESRRAFYAGAGAMLGGMLSGMTSGDEPEDADMDMMDGLQAELDQFTADVVAGKA